MGPKVQKETRSSQATPLAEDFLKILQGQIAEGSFGQGAGPLQRNAGTAIQQFVQSLQERTKGGTGGPDTTSPLIDAVTRLSQTNTNRSAADLREGAGIAGNRFGTAGALGEARLRSDAGMNLDQTVGSILQSQSQFDTNTGLKLNDQLSQAIAQLFGQGEANTGVFERMSALGILPEELIVSPGIGDQLLSGAMNAGAAYLTGGASLAMPGGGPGGSGGPQVMTLPNNGGGLGLQNPANRARAGTFQLDPRLFGG